MVTLRAGTSSLPGCGLLRRGREMQGSAGVHGHGDAESLGKFLFAAAGLEASIGVEGDAMVATRSDGPTGGDELHFFAQKGAFEFAAERVW